MDLVVDANVVFAALIKDSFSCNLLFSEKHNLFTPEYVLIEFEKHKEEILKKTERTTEEFFRVLEILRRRMTFVLKPSQQSNQLSYKRRTNRSNFSMSFLETNIKTVNPI